MSLIWFEGNAVGMVPVLLYGIISMGLLGYFLLIIRSLSTPPDAKLLIQAKRGNFNKVLFWIFDKSKLSWLVAGKILGKGIYEIGKNKVVIIPKTPYTGRYPDEINEMLGAEKHELDQQKNLDLQKETKIQRLLDGVHRLKKINAPVYFVYSGQSMALNPDTVAALGITVKEGEEVIAYFGHPMIPSSDIAPALGKRTTDSQLRFIAQTYRNLGKEEAEGTAGKIMIGMIVFAIAIVGIFIFLWQGGYLG